MENSMVLRKFSLVGPKFCVVYGAVVTSFNLCSTLGVEATVCILSWAALGNDISSSHGPSSVTHQTQSTSWELVISQGQWHPPHTLPGKDLPSPAIHPGSCFWLLIALSKPPIEPNVRCLLERIFKNCYGFNCKYIKLLEVNITFHSIIHGLKKFYNY